MIVICNWKIPNLPLQLEELIVAFDKNKTLFNPDHISLEEREKVRSSFVHNFPVDKILEMKLDDYVAGKRDPLSNQVDKSTFCYRLERELDILSGIGGVPAKKFGIYFNHENQDYEYDKEKFDSPEKVL